MKQAMTKIWGLFGWLVTLSMLATPSFADIVRAENYNAFWLWAGVKPQAALNSAKEIYVLAGEVNDGPRVVSQRAAVPKISHANVWIVYRAQTMNWDASVMAEVLRHATLWQRAGNKIVGLQIDFDAGTKQLERYAEFLRSVRAELPREFKLSVTGLLDWSANGDPAGLDAIAGVVDEVVLQIYQGRRVIPGYAGYLAKLDRMKMKFRIGLLQGGDWTAPEGLEGNEKFDGYVVFLVNN